MSMLTVGERAVTTLKGVTDAEPLGVWSAPGRVNLIGEHTDYNDGFVLPFAIGARTACALAPRNDRIVRVASAPGWDCVELNLDQLEPAAMAGWSAYVFGVFWALADAGVSLDGRTGFDIAFASDVPVGAGLSSSAAIECAVAVALDELWATGLGRMELAKVCRKAENIAVGAPTGILDQSASLMCAEGLAVMLDCESLAVTPVPLPLADAGLTILVIDTKVSHSHATGSYASRRQSCERGAAAMGVATLRGLSEADLARASEVLDDETLRRVRHVVTENARVLLTVETLTAHGPTAIGHLMLESHASMRDDFEISVPELDAAVEAAVGAGALGARMTGGGFGGSAIALVPDALVGSVTRDVLDRFAAQGFATPHIFTVTPSAGAGRDQ